MRKCTDWSGESTWVCVNRGRALGVHTIVLSLAALLVSAILHKSLAAKPLSDIDGGLSAVIGVVLLLVSLLLRSGAEQAAEAR